MAIKGVPPSAPLVKAETGPNDDAVQNLADPLNSALAAIHAAFSGSASAPVLNGQSLGVIPKINLPQGVTVQVVNDHLVYRAPSGNSYRLDRQAVSSSTTPSGSITLSQIPPGSNGQVLTTVAGATAWSAPTTGTTYTTFGPSGTSHATGLVPDPGSVTGTVKYLREDATWVTPPNATYTTFGPSGSSHAIGLVPDPGATSGTTRFLREDATWGVPPSGTTYTTFVASGPSHAGGLVPDPGSTAGTTRYLREDATWTALPAGTSYSVFGASGTSHTSGLVPDPGATAGTTRYLREDSTFQTPPVGPTYSNFVASGTSAAAGLVPSPGTTAGTTRFLREDATWVAVAASGASGITQLTSDVTTPASSSGSTVATIVSVGGQSAAAVAAGAVAANNATSTNTVSTIAARDAYGAIFHSTGVVSLAAQSVTVTALQSGTTFIAASGSNNITMIANPTGVSLKFRFIGNGGAISINPVASGTTTFYCFGTSTTYAINQVNSNVGDCIEITGIPGTQNFIVNNIQGNWQSGGNALGVYSTISYPGTAGQVLTANGNTGLAAYAALPSTTAAQVIKVVNKTAAYTVVAADMGTWFTITGASSLVTFTMPLTTSLVPGWTCYFLVSVLAANAGIKILPNASDRIYMETGTTTASTGYISTSTSRTQAQSIGISNISANSWYPTYGYSLDWGIT